MKNLQKNSVRWVLIRHYWKSMKRWFPVWISYEEMNQSSFSPATEFERERFGCCVRNNQIMAYEEEVSDRSTAFQIALLKLEKERKESENRGFFLQK